MKKRPQLAHFFKKNICKLQHKHNTDIEFLLISTLKSLFTRACLRLATGVLG